jgi:hypothetical protein
MIVVVSVNHPGQWEQAMAEQLLLQMFFDLAFQALLQKNVVQFTSPRSLE